MSFPCHYVWLPVSWAALSLLAPGPASAQFFAHCDSASQAELEQSLLAYQEHNFRLAHKFLDGYYLQGELPEDFDHVSLEEIRAGLAADGSRRSALLFHAHSGYAFCAWLVTATGLTSAVTPVGDGDYQSLVLALRAALGVAASEQNRSPRRRGVRPADTAPAHEGEAADSLLARLGDVLVPGPVRGALLEEEIDSLLVTPLANTATLPLAALPVDAERELVDVASISPAGRTRRSHPRAQAAFA